MNTNDDTIDGLMEMVQCYCNTVCEHLYPTDHEYGDQKNEELYPELMVHFLFPNLSEKERELLEEMLVASRLLNKLGCVKQPKLTKEQDARWTEIESMFVSSRNKLAKLNAESRMSQVQRVIFEREFVDIRFAE